MRPRSSGREADLDAIATLGFRGEALPAIFAVSRLSLLSRPRRTPRGFLIAGEGGVVGESGPADATAGTTVEVRDLFFNTPARAKFLKSPATEQAAIVRVVTQLALANPRVHLRLLANGRVAPERARRRRPAGAGRRPVRLRAGGAPPGRVGRGSGARVAGVVAPPALSRTHRDDIHLIVNGRVVRDTLLTQALLEAYRPLLPRDQFPLAALALALDPSEVDVNVHPAKTWVRFRRPRVLYGVVLDAVRTALRQMDAAPAGLVARIAGDEAGPAGAVMPAPGLAGSPDSPAGRGATRRRPPCSAKAKRATGASHSSAAWSARSRTPSSWRTRPTRSSSSTSTSRTSACSSSGCAATSSAARSRRRSCCSRSRSSWPRRACGRSSASTPSSRGSGSRSRDSEGDAILLRAVPSLLRTEDLPRLADELSQELDEDAGQGSSPVLDRLLAFVACRAAIKAHQALAPEEMAQVLTDLAETATPYYCPHGRPIVSRIPLGEIKRELRRTW